MEKGTKTLTALARSEMRQERRESVNIDDGSMPTFLPSFRSRSHSRDSEAFEMSHGHILNTSPYTNGRRHDDEYHNPSSASADPSSAHTNTSSRLPTPSRTFSASTVGSFPPYTPSLKTTSPQAFNSFTTSPTNTIQPQMAIPHGQHSHHTLPSLKELGESGIFPSMIASNLPRHHSPIMPVTTH